MFNIAGDVITNARAARRRLVLLSNGGARGEFDRKYGDLDDLLNSVIGLSTAEGQASDSESAEPAPATTPS